MSIYKSKEVACFRQPLVDPVVHITKIYRSETREEKFYFRIKGVFHVINDSVTFEVHYSHSLFIDIVPKDMLL